MHFVPSKVSCAGVRGGRGSSRSRRGFTLVEVVMASVVLAFGLVTSIICIQIGVRDMDVARTGTAVAQAMQNEMERLRLEDWEGISNLPAEQALDLAGTFSADSAIRDRVTVVRRVSDVPGFAQMKEVVLSARWTSIDGRSHQRTFRMRYAKNGLHDYYYRSTHADA